MSAIVSFPEDQSLGYLSLKETTENSKIEPKWPIWSIPKLDQMEDEMDEEVEIVNKDLRNEKLSHLRNQVQQLNAISWTRDENRTRTQRFFPRID